MLRLLGPFFPRLLFVFILSATPSFSKNVVIASDQSGSGHQNPEHQNPEEEEIEQVGGGANLSSASSLLNEPTLEKLALLVAKKLEKNSIPSTSARPVITNWNTYERCEPSVAVSVPDNTSPPTAYDYKIVKTDLNDQKDTEKVLRKIPKKHLANAVRLLESFEERSDELTYDCSGTIYVDQQSIPNSNIFELMPHLFKKQASKLAGFKDFVNKIIQMNLEHLIAYRPKEVRLISKSAPSSSNTNWWYLGP